MSRDNGVNGSPFRLSFLWKEDRHLISDFGAIKCHRSEEDTEGFSFGKHFVLTIFLNEDSLYSPSLQRSYLLVDELPFVGNGELHTISLDEFALTCVVGGYGINLTICINHVLTIEYAFHYFATDWPITFDGTGPGDVTFFGGVGNPGDIAHESACSLEGGHGALEELLNVQECVVGHSGDYENCRLATSRDVACNRSCISMYVRRPACAPNAPTTLAALIVPARRALGKSKPERRAQVAPVPKASPAPVVSMVSCGRIGQW